MRTVTKLEPCVLSGTTIYYPLLMCVKEPDAYAMAKFYRRLSHKAQVVRYDPQYIHNGKPIYRFMVFVSRAELVF